MSDELRLAKVAILMLNGIEAHCRNDAKLIGVDHADEGKRIRRFVQMFINDPEVKALLKRPSHKDAGK